VGKSRRSARAEGRSATSLDGATGYTDILN
jgi:hypothetical protein